MMTSQSKSGMIRGERVEEPKEDGCVDDEGARSAESEMVKGPSKRVNPGTESRRSKVKGDRRKRTKREADNSYVQYEVLPNMDAI